MPYDYYDYFTKDRTHPLFTETENIIRQSVWSDSRDFINIMNWTDTEEKNLIKLYWLLRYN